MSAPRLGIGVIGAGRVGAVLAAALRAEGHGITGAYAVSDASRARAEDLLPGVPLLDVPAIVERSEMLLLAVPDDQLGPLAAGIASTGLVPGGQLAVHTSGLHGNAVLEPLAKAGCATIALHPAMTFSGTREDLPRLVGCPMAITAEPDFLPVAAALVVELGGGPTVLSDADRPLYHAALAHGANHLVVLVDQVRDALSHLGIDNPGAYARPLLEAALDESLRRGAAALTGPVKRGDAGTVAAHLGVFADLDAAAKVTGHGDAAVTYRVLARAALARAGLGAEAERSIQELLEREGQPGRTGPHGEPGLARSDGGTMIDSQRERTTSVVRTKQELRERRAAMDGTVAVVMTMGSLHEGHLMLVERARELADNVILTDFVNPLQFGPDEDFDAYPRDLEADVAMVEGRVDLVFAPTTEEMYPTLPPMVSVTANETATLYEGASRPGHFNGVVTVVTKLLNLTSPHIAVFGRKDAQQLAIVEALVKDLDLPVRIEPVDIQREPEGLARSSRNLFLSPEGRRHALGLSATIAAAQQAAPSLTGVLRVLEQAREGTAPYSADTTGLRFDYALALDPMTLRPVAPDHRGPTLVMLAGWVDGTRLLDAAVVPTTEA